MPEIKMNLKDFMREHNRLIKLLERHTADKQVAKEAKAQSKELKSVMMKYGKR